MNRKKWQHLRDVILLGGQSAHPDIPAYDISGSLYDAPEGLVFESSTGRTTLVIPWENMNKWGWNHGEVGGVEGVLWKLGAIVTAFSLGLLSPWYVYVYVDYRDFHTGTNVEVLFKVGPHHQENAAQSLWRDITNGYGKHQRERASAMSVFYRE